MAIALENIIEALSKTLKTDNVPEISKSTHLLEEDILDSLDALVFFLELEKISGVKIKDEDFDDQNIYIVENILNYSS